VFCSTGEKREKVEKCMGLRNPQNALKKVLKIGSIWKFPAKIK